MASMKTHRRQFVICTAQQPEWLSSLPDFKTRKLIDGVYLHHDNELGISETDDGLVLGREIRPGDGRYVKINKTGWLSLDTTGSLGVHYLSEAGTVVSSSPMLLAAAC